MKTKLTIALLAVAAMSGCTKEDSGSENLEASFSSAIETRVSGVEWELDDQIGIMVTSDNLLIDAYRYNNLYDVSFTDPEHGIFTANSQADRIYYSVEEDVKIHFYAYYPYNEDLVEADEEITIDVTDQRVPKEIDFMEASTRDTEGYNKSSGTVVLNFSRNMAKITLNLKTSDGVVLDDITRVYATGYYSSGTYGFESNEFISFGATDVEIEFYKEDDDTHSAIMIPENYTTKMIYFTTTHGDVPLNMSSYTLEKGVNKLYTVTVSQTAAISDTHTIEEWDDDVIIEAENESFEND